MARQYHSLLERQDGMWVIEFGDWDRETVEAERESYRDHGSKAKDLKIITTSGSQKAIDAAVNKLNDKLPPAPTLPRGELAVLRYFRQGFVRDPGQYWLPADRTPFKRLLSLKRQALLERKDAPGMDLWRITAAGLRQLEG